MKTQSFQSLRIGDIFRYANEINDPDASLYRKEPDSRNRLSGRKGVMKPRKGWVSGSSVSMTRDDDAVVLMYANGTYKIAERKRKNPYNIRGFKSAERKGPELFNFGPFLTEKAAGIEAKSRLRQHYLSTGDATEKIKDVRKGRKLVGFRAPSASAWITPVRANIGRRRRNSGVKRIEVDANRWRDSSGNTYHVVSVGVNGKHVWTSPITYGYGTQYERTATRWLEKNGYIKDSGGYLHRYCDKNGIEYSVGHRDVKRKKDLGV